jgi:uncharacterized protein (TIGR02217 family)
MPSFLEDRLPINIDYGSSFGEEYAVEIDTTANGNEYRRLRHNAPRARYDLSFDMRQQLWVMDEVVALYHRVFGKFAGFRVKNLADFSSNGYTGTPAFGNQVCAPVSAGVYQLQKSYGGVGGTISVGRPIRTVFKPVTGSVLIGVNGASYPTAQWSVNTVTGRVTMAANKSRAITAITKAAQAVVTVGAHTMLVGESVGFTGVAGMTQINGLRALITAISGTTITVAINSTAFGTYTSGGTVQTNPITGEQVTAGFEFDLPMRFDSDISGLTFDTFDTLSTGGINLVEILNP